MCANTLEDSGALAQYPAKSILLRSTGFGDVHANSYPKFTSKFVLVNLKPAFLRSTAWESWLQPGLQKYKLDHITAVVQ